MPLQSQHHPRQHDGSRPRRRRGGGGQERPLHERGADGASDAASRGPAARRATPPTAAPPPHSAHPWGSTYPLHTTPWGITSPYPPHGYTHHHRRRTKPIEREKPLHRRTGTSHLPHHQTAARNVPTARQRQVPDLPITSSQLNIIARFNFRVALSELHRPPDIERIKTTDYVILTKFQYRHKSNSRTTARCRLQSGACICLAVGARQAAATSPHLPPPTTRRQPPHRAPPHRT